LLYSTNFPARLRPHLLFAQNLVLEYLL